jgi:hypothetical protein
MTPIALRPGGVANAMIVSITAIERREAQVDLTMND